MGMQHGNQILPSRLCTGQLWVDVTIEFQQASYNVDLRKQTFNAIRLLRSQLRTLGLTKAGKCGSLEDTTHTSYLAELAEIPHLLITQRTNKQKQPNSAIS